MEVEAYYSAVIYERVADGIRLKGWNFAQLGQARQMTERRLGIKVAHVGQLEYELDAG